MDVGGEGCYAEFFEAIGGGEFFVLRCGADVEAFHVAEEEVAGERGEVGSEVAAHVECTAGSAGVADECAGAAMVGAGYGSVGVPGVVVG